MVQSDFECVARGLAGAEGPLTTRDGRMFVVVPSKSRIVEVMRDGSTRDLVVYEGGLPAGLQLDRNGDIWVADMKMGILRVTADGKLSEEVTLFQNERIRGCNDNYFDSQGNLYFTAPAGSHMQNAVGELFVRMANGTVIRLDDGFQFSNGLAVTADDKTLIVAETFTKRLYAYDISTPGVASDKRHWATLPGEHRGGPDGMDFDCEGNLLVANWGGGAVEVFNPAGQHVDRIELPFNKPSNVHFFKPGSNELLITEHDEHALWRTTWKHEGQMQYGWT